MKSYKTGDLLTISSALPGDNDYVLVGKPQNYNCDFNCWHWDICKIKNNTICVFVEITKITNFKHNVSLKEFDLDDIHDIIDPSDYALIFVGSSLFVCDPSSLKKLDH
jgi:hypothetical protein